MDGTDVKQGKGWAGCGVSRGGGGGGGGGEGVRGLTAAVKAGNAGFRIES